MVLVNKWYLLVKNGPHVGLSGSSWKQFRDAGGSHAARVPAAPTRPLGLLLTASSTSSPPSCGHCFPSPHQPSACYARDIKGRVSRNSAVATGEAFRCRDLAFGYQRGKPCPALAFHPFSRLRTLNAAEPPNVALINWLRFPLGCFAFSINMIRKQEAPGWS